MPVAFGYGRPSDGALAVFAHPVHVGQLLTAPQTGHQRVLILKDTRPARYAVATRATVTSTSTAAAFQCPRRANIYRQ